MIICKTAESIIDRGETNEYETPELPRGIKETRQLIQGIEHDYLLFQILQIKQNPWYLCAQHKY